MRVRSWLTGLVLLALGSVALAQYEGIGNLKVKKPEDKQDVKPAPAPDGAIVLFNGKDLDGWTNRDGNAPAQWQVLDGGILQVKTGSGDICTKQQIDAPVKLHVEFRVPLEDDRHGQDRGNSGVYLQGRYETQVLDSYGIEKPGVGDCGAIYGIEAPTTNAAKAPTVWQSYDIEFHPPKFENGKKVEPARATVIWNGVKVHDNTAITSDNTTSGRGGDPSQPGPLMLQDHGHAVQYRNVWMKKMEK